MKPRSPGTQVAIDGRATVRQEIGGVERMAREMAARLPALRPGRYELRPRPRPLAHRAGHAWEQVVLPPTTAAPRSSTARRTWPRWPRGATWW